MALVDEKAQRRSYLIKDNNKELIEAIEIDSTKKLEQRVESLTNTFNVKYYGSFGLQDSYLLTNIRDPKKFFVLRTSSKGELIRVGYHSDSLPNITFSQSAVDYNKH